MQQPNPIQPDFDLEFRSNLPNADDGIRSEAEERLRKLARGHWDITGAFVDVSREIDRNNSSIYRARVVVYIRPENLTAAEERESPESALKGALRDVERQVREKRERLRARWRHP